jgi:hypothetical protein
VSNYIGANYKDSSNAGRRKQLGMIRQRVWPTVAVLLLLRAPEAIGQSVSLKPSELAPFLGTWVLTMTEPEALRGSEQTVRIWDKNGVVAASVGTKFPPAANVTGILQDGNMLVLTISQRAQPGMLENGAPIWAIISLTLDGETMKAAEMLEKSQTIKRGTGKKQAN